MLQINLSHGFFVPCFSISIASRIVFVMQWAMMLFAFRNCKLFSNVRSYNIDKGILGRVQILYIITRQVTMYWRYQAIIYIYEFCIYFFLVFIKILIRTLCFSVGKILTKLWLSYPYHSNNNLNFLCSCYKSMGDLILKFVQFIVLVKGFTYFDNYTFWEIIPPI